MSRSRRLIVPIVVFLLTASCGGSERVASTLGTASPIKTVSPSPSASPAEPSPLPSDGPTQTTRPTPVDEHDKDDVEGDSGIKGRVMAGPTCAAEQEGESCPDRPVSGADVTIKGEGYHANTTTSAGGRFVADAPPGSYVITVRTDQAMGCEEETVTVSAGRFTETTISCDTGIR